MHELGILWEHDWPELNWPLTYDQVHEHCWTVVRWAILGMGGSGDNASKMLRFYAGLLEHFLGVKPRSPEDVRPKLTP